MAMKELGCGKLDTMVDTSAICCALGCATEARLRNGLLARGLKSGGSVFSSLSILGG